MTAVQIIEEIRQLAPEEQERVVGFVSSLARARKLSSEELNELAKKLANARTDEEANALKEQIAVGFYGE